MKKLDGKVAIITGGSSGLGKGIAFEFASEGANVVIASRNMAKLEKVAEEIEVLGKRPLVVVADVRIREQVQDIMKQTMEEFGSIDILVNNAGISRRAILLEMTDEDWDDVLDTNLKSVFLCTQAVAKQMMQQNYGKIINMASVGGRGVNEPWLANYCTSKAGVIELTKCYAKVLGPYNINVNAIAPGLIVTDMILTGRTPEQLQEFKEQNIKSTVLGRLGTINDITKLALYLASDESSFIAGQTIPIDGGKTNRM